MVDSANMVNKEELRQQFVEVFETAEQSTVFAVPTPDDYATFESGDFSITAAELNTKLHGVDFPHDDAESFARDVIEQLEEQNLI